MRPVVSLAFVLCFAVNSSGNLVISGVVDGNESGGLPKGVELVALQNIPNLSVYSIGRYTNGGSAISSVTLLPAMSLSQGSFFYITGTTTSDTFFTSNGFPVGLSNQNVANINGNDLLSIVLTANNAVPIDTFGLPGQGSANFYADSIAYRNSVSQTGVPTGLLNAANFTVTPWVNSADFGARFGTFTVVAIPEPGAVLFGALVCGVVSVVLAGRRIVGQAKLGHAS